MTKIWLKTVTAEQLAKVEVGDWLEGYGDILSLATKRLVRRFGRLFCCRIEQLKKQLKEGHHCASFEMCEGAGQKYEAKIEQQQNMIRELIKAGQQAYAGLCTGDLGTCDKGIELLDEVVPKAEEML